MSLQPPALRTLNLFSFPGSFARIVSIVPSNSQNLSSTANHKSGQTQARKAFQNLRGWGQAAPALKPRLSNHFRRKIALSVFYTDPSAQIALRGKRGEPENHIKQKTPSYPSASLRQSSLSYLDNSYRENKTGHYPPLT